MLNKIFITFTLFLSFFLWWNALVFAAAPEVNCVWLPGCVDRDIVNPTAPNISDNIGLEVVTSIIWEAIQFVAVVAVIALILSGIMYLVSWWEEEKVKKAKTWIIWSLVWVLLSISAWGIINMLNKLTIW